MSAINERKYFEKDDRRFKFKRFFEKFGFIRPPAAYFFNLFFKLNRLGPKNRTNNLVIVSLARIGDTVFTIPAVRLILENYLAYNITLLCYPESEPVYKIAIDGLDIKTVNKNNFYFKRRIADSGIRKFFKSLKPEIIFDLTGSVTSASLIFSSHAETVIGANQEFFKSVYTKYRLPRTEPRFMDIYLDTVSLAIDFKRDESLYTFNTIVEKNKKILIHPFAIRQAKEWKLKNFISLAAELKKSFPVAMISPNGFITEEALAEIKNNGIELIYTPTIADLIEVLKDSSLFISNDSGPTHIASLLGKPTFTIYGPTNPGYSHPAGDKHRYYWKQLDCTAGMNEMVCYTLGGIYCTHHKCLNETSVSEVLDSLNDFITFLQIRKFN